MKALKEKCGTCPFKPGSPYAELAGYLSAASLKNSRTCHSTGQSVIYGDTGKPEMICRGSRDLQIEIFHKIGFLDAPTDEAWESKVKECEL